MSIKHAMIFSCRIRKKNESITLKTQKPLIKLGNKNLLERSIDLLINHGVEEIAINVHHLSHQIKDFINDKKLQNKNYNF